MSLVTGFGNEVITVTVAFVVTTVISIVWRSTRVRERPQFVAATVDVTGGRDAASQDAASREGGIDGEPATADQEEVIDDVDDADCVTIRVRFIDETQFEARSPLSATLGQFKSRHLRPTTNGSSPIRANDRVRLIFNGKVLGSDSSTLAQVCSFHWPTNGVCWLLCPRNDRFGQG